MVVRARWVVFGLFIAVSAYLLAVTPVQTYLQQRHAMQTAELRNEVLSSANKQLTDRVTQLQTDAEIQRLAREQYELVPPGSQAYAVMPAPVPTPPPPPKKQNKSLISRVWDDVTFWN